MNILNRLLNDARITDVALAGSIHLSPAPCLKRVRDQDPWGVICDDTTLFESEKLGWDLDVIIVVP